MPFAPYPISGIVYDKDGTTAQQSANVAAYNKTTGEWLPNASVAITNSAGEYTIDLANLPSGYSNSDVIFVHAWHATKERSLDHRTTVNTVAGSESKNLVLHYNITSRGPCRIRAAFGGNTTAGGLRVDWYDRKLDNIIIPMEVPTADSKSAFFGEKGLKVQDAGFAVIYESETGGSPPSLMASTVINDST